MRKGFTLVELMIVMVVIAILIAILFPTFLSFRRDALVARAQGDLRTLQTEVEGFYGRWLNTATPGYPAQGTGFGSVLTSGSETGLGQLLSTTLCSGPPYATNISRDPFNTGATTYFYDVIMSTDPVGPPVDTAGASNGVGYIIASPGPNLQWGASTGGTTATLFQNSFTINTTAGTVSKVPSGATNDDIVVSNFRVIP